MSPEILSKTTIRYKAPVSLLKSLHQQDFGKYEKSDRLSLCPLARELFSLEGVSIGNVRIERTDDKENTTYITLQSLGPIFNDQTIDMVSAFLERRLKPMQIAANPPIYEEKLIARLAQDQFIPDEDDFCQFLFASYFNEVTLPGVRGHGGYIKVIDFIDDRETGNYSVNVLVDGSCMGCGSAGVLTIRDLQENIRDIFKQAPDIVGERKFDTIYVYESRTPDKLSYAVNSYGVLNPQGEFIKKFEP